MPRRSFSIEIGAPCEAVFDTIHDYARRLEWDSMLSEARLLSGASAAGIGVRSICVGTWRSCFLAVETEYIRFERGQVAAVKLTNRPLLFGNFAATIRHHALANARSRITYTYSFRARPKFLAPFLEPIMNLLIAGEVQGRLEALRGFLEAGGRPDRIKD
jgi:hypothetical protein